MNMTDHSQIQEYKECGFRYKLHYKEGFRKREEDQTEHHANFGGAVHAGLEAHYKGGEWEAVKKAFCAAYPVQLDSDDKAKTQENGLTLLKSYVSRYGEQDKARWEVLSVEETDTFQVVGGVDHVVKLDLVVRDRASGEVYGVDHKTTGKSLDYRYWNQFDPNTQITTYCAYMEQKYGSCSGMWINGISFGFRQRMYKGEPAGFHCDMKRNLFNRNPHQVEAWRKDVLQWIAKMQEAEKTGWYGKNTAFCGWCSYRPICVAEWTPEEDEQNILVQFEKVDPMEYLKRKGMVG